MEDRTKRKNVGLIGAGGFALSHFKMLVENGAANGMRLVAVADPSTLAESTITALARHSIRQYGDYEEMFSQEELDGVFIATPIPTHFSMTRSALHRGLRVYLEKPPVASLAQIGELIRLDAKESVQVGFNMMNWPVIRRALARVRRGEFGEIHSLRALALWPRNSRYYSRASWAGKMGSPDNPIFDGPATNAMSHYVQLLCAAGSAAGGGRPVDVRGEFYRARAIESYDTCSLTGRFSDGPRFSVVMSHAAGPGQSTVLTIETDKGVFTVDDSLFSRIGTSRFGQTIGFAHRDFGRLLNGKMKRPRVGLADCVDFLEIISQGLASSQGITSIPAEYVVRMGEGPEELFVVPDLRERALRCTDSFQTFSEAGAPWCSLAPVL
ncbi:MAG: Gfo/Idh/MocA family protein [Terrimicrobiaceae bacterium]